MKIAVVITARASYSRIKTFVEELNNDPFFDLKVVIAASAVSEKYGNLEEVLNKDGLKVDAKLNTLLNPVSIDFMGKTTSTTISELSTYFLNNRPDAVVTIADRFETIATSIAASYMNIPLIHVQGGELSGNIDEKVRHANTKFADLHFVSTQKAKRVLLQMGEDEERIHVTGCPSIDLVKRYVDKDFDLEEIWRTYGGVGPKFTLEENQYLVVLQHPETNHHEKSRKYVLETLSAVKTFDFPAIWFWPNVDNGTDGTSKGIREFRERHPDLEIHYFKNLHPKHFLNLVNKSKCLVGNSSMGIRECSYMGQPVINIGERQKNRERGNNVIDVGYEQQQILDGLNMLMSREIRKNDLYGNGDAGIRMKEILKKTTLRYEKEFKVI